MSDKSIEPWLRGAMEGVPLPVMPLFFSFALVREDLLTHVQDLTTEEIWKPVAGPATVGFHIRHLAGSVDRLVTYLEDKQLRAEQLAFLQNEKVPGADFAELFAETNSELQNAEQRLLQLDLSSFDAPRYVGRQRLEVTALGLLVHIAEHTQRHSGQIITTTKILKNQR